MKITEMALRASRLTYFVALIIFVAGIATFLNFPSQEEPTVTVRDAMVTALNPGLPAERVEQLIARPIEERLRELAEVKRVTSTVRAGSAMIQVTIWDRYTDLAPIWRARFLVETLRLPCISTSSGLASWSCITSVLTTVNGSNPSTCALCWAPPC